MNEQLANSGEHLTETATTLQKQIPEILKRDDLTFEEADRLHRPVDNVCDQSERLIDLLHDQDADPDLVDTAEQIGSVHESIGTRVIALLKKRKRSRE